LAALAVGIGTLATFAPPAQASHQCTGFASQPLTYFCVERTRTPSASVRGEVVNITREPFCFIIGCVSPIAVEAAAVDVDAEDTLVAYYMNTCYYFGTQGGTYHVVEIVKPVAGPDAC
jgi:hypothetical protein